MSEELTVRQSEDDRTIAIEGTMHALRLVRFLLSQLLDGVVGGAPERDVAAKNEKSGVQIIVRLLE